MSKAENYVNTLIDILSDIKQSYEFNEKNIIDANNEEKDILHQIELGKFNVVQGYYWAKEMKRVRNERRVAKDENTTLKFLYDYFIQFDEMVKQLQVFRGAIKREQEKLNTRLYKPRFRKDLTIPLLGNFNSNTQMSTRLKKVGGM